MGIRGIEAQHREQLNQERCSGTTGATYQEVVFSLFLIQDPYPYFGAIRIPPSMRTVSPFMYEWITRKWANSANSDVVPRRFG